MRREVVQRISGLVPAHPPCFADRLSWVEYVASAHHALKSSKKFSVIPVVVVEEGVEVFNHNWPYCTDCSAQHSHRMTLVGRCDPYFLKRRVQEALSA